MRRRLDITLIATILALGGLPASAAQYKWIDGDGGVNYSDRLPPHDAQVLGSHGAAPADGEAGLPYAIRQASTKYPVLLYTSTGCEPCGTARNHLIKRGIPFTEYTLRSQADADAYARAGFDGKTVPGIKVGRQTSSGYEAAALDALLDAAGYPKSARLPSHYARPAPRPLAGGAQGVKASAGDDQAPLGQAAGLQGNEDPNAVANGLATDEAPTTRQTAAPAPRPPSPPAPAAGPTSTLRF